jgi:CubicO group peptidase (beta-lactamase class C family)
VRTAVGPDRGGRRRRCTVSVAPLLRLDPSTITVADLLDHGSGIPDFSVELQCPTGRGELTAYFAQHGDQPLWTPPGRVWNYTNQGFAIAGWVLEAVSGQRFEDAVAERVFAKAGMTTAGYEPSVATASSYAMGHYDGRALSPDAYDCAATRPPAGVLASVTDYAHFAETLLRDGGSMLTSASVAAMETGHIDTDQKPAGSEQYGYGLVIRDGYKGQHVVRHEGSDYGYQTSIWMVPDQNFAVIVFYNARGRAPMPVSERALDLYLGLGDVPAPDDKTSVDAWGQYVGTYVDPYNLGEITVRLEGDRLQLSALHEGVSALPMTQAAGDVFNVSLGSEVGSVTFYPGATGPAGYLVTRQGVGLRQ